MTVVPRLVARPGRRTGRTPTIDLPPATLARRAHAARPSPAAPSRVARAARRASRSPCSPRERRTRDATFAVWAPGAAAVELALGDGGASPMRRGDGGWWQRRRADAAARRRDYGFVVDGGAPLPDPRSPWQPDGVHGPSPRRRPRRLRAGPTQAGGAPAARRRRCSTSCTSARSRPRAPSTARSRSSTTWSTSASRRRADAGRGVPRRPRLGLRRRRPLRAAPRLRRARTGSKRLVDACHARGLAVILDVVYNHLGPAGNYLARFGPYFTDRYRTPWGDARQLRRARQRRGAPLLRRQRARCGCATTTSTGCASTRCTRIVDSSARPHPRGARATRCDALARAARARSSCVIAESDLNDPRLVRPRGGRRLRARRAVERRLPPRPARRAHRRARTATTPTSARLADLAKALAARLRLRRPLLAATAGGRHGRPGRRASPGTASSASPRTTTRSATAPGASASAHLVGPGRAAGSARRCCSRRRSCRCCSRARSGPRRRRSSTSPTTATPSSAEAVREGRRREFAAFGWARARRCPTPRRARPSSARSSTGTSARASRHADAARLVPATDPPAARRRRRWRDGAPGRRAVALRRGGALAGRASAGRSPWRATSPTSPETFPSPVFPAPGSFSRGRTARGWRPERWRSRATRSQSSNGGEVPRGARAFRQVENPSAARAALTAGRSPTRAK